MPTPSSPRLNPPICIHLSSNRHHCGTLLSEKFRVSEKMLIMSHMLFRGAERLCSADRQGQAAASIRATKALLRAR